MNTGLLTPGNSNTELSTSELAEAGRSKRRRLEGNRHGTNTDSNIGVSGNGAALSPTVVRSPDTTSTGFDLTPSQDICADLRSQIRKSGEIEVRSTYLGHIFTSQENFKHFFYRGEIMARPNQPFEGRLSHPPSTVSVDRFLNQPIERMMTLVEQLKLAAQVVVAVLKFHETPWLQTYWKLDNLSLLLFDGRVTDVSKSLLVGTEFFHFPSTQDSDMHGVEHVPNTRDQPNQDITLQLGIRNLALYSLGVALLQIGQWRRIRADDVVGVRKLAMGIPRLGPKYQALTRKCLDCDFGIGDDLNDQPLQKALYDKVYWELESMAASLDL
jgi:hypothetical protein